MQVHHTAICVSVIQSWGFFILICSDMLQACYYSQKRSCVPKERFSESLQQSQKHHKKPSLATTFMTHLKTVSRSFQKHSAAALAFPDFTLKLKYNVLPCPQHIINYTPNEKHLASVFSPLPLCSLQHFMLYN